MILQATIRYRDGSWELRCERCAALRRVGPTYWPLTLEFWDPTAMTRCRACHKEVKRQKNKSSYARDEERRKAALASGRAYYRALDDEERRIMMDKKREQRRRWENEWRAERREHFAMLDQKSESKRASNREHMRRVRQDKAA